MPISGLPRTNYSDTSDSRQSTLRLGITFGGAEETYLYCWNWIGMTGGAPKSDIVSARKRRKARVEKEREDVLVPVQGSSRL